MTRINQELLNRIVTKSGLSKRQVYRLIEDKTREMNLERNLAVLKVASDYKINTAKYTKPEDFLTIRGSLYPIQKSVGALPSSINPIIRKPKKVIEPIILDLVKVKNSELRDILERDIAELNLARSQGLDKTAKTCMVLCGSIIEALLLERLSQDLPKSVATASLLATKRSGKLSNNPEEWDLADLITVAINFPTPLLPDDASTGAHQLRHWRNLIHPGRELKEARNKRIRPTRERANNAIAYLQFISKELQ